MTDHRASDEPYPGDEDDIPTLRASAHRAVFWEHRYKTQHNTLHRCEDALAAAVARAEQAEKERDEARADLFSSGLSSYEKALEARVAALEQQSTARGEALGLERARVAALEAAGDALADAWACDTTFISADQQAAISAWRALRGQQ